MRRLLTIWFFACTMIAPVTEHAYSQEPDTLAYYSFTGTNGTNISGQTLDIGGDSWNNYNSASEIQIQSNQGEVYSESEPGKLFDRIYYVEVSHENQYDVQILWRATDNDANRAGVVAKFDTDTSDSCLVMYYQDTADQINIEVITSGSGSYGLPSGSAAFSASTDANDWYRMRMKVFDPDSVVGELYHYTDDNFSTVLDTLILTIRSTESDIALRASRDGFGIFSRGGNNIPDVTYDDFVVIDPYSQAVSSVRRRGLRR